jgi:hypothetical protein
MNAPTKRVMKRVSPPSDGTANPRSPGRPRPSEDDEEDEAEAESRSHRRSPKNEVEELRGGWSAAQDTMDSTSSFAQALKPEEKSQVIKFLQDDPYVNYRRHWIERSTPQGKNTRSYTCLRSFGKDCPLCEVGDRAQAVAAFNVALIGDDGVVSLKSWDVGPKIFNILKGYANDPKIAPLTRGFFLVSRTGKKGTVNHQVIPVKPSALEEDYDIPVPDKAAFDRLEKYEKDIVEVPTRKTLDEVAQEIADDYA